MIFASAEEKRQLDFVQKYHYVRATCTAVCPYAKRTRQSQSSAVTVFRHCRFKRGLQGAHRLLHEPGQWYMLLSLPVRLFFHLSSKCNIFLQKKNEADALAAVVCGLHQTLAVHVAMTYGPKAGGVRGAKTPPFYNFHCVQMFSNDFSKCTPHNHSSVDLGYFINVQQ